MKTCNYIYSIIYGKLCTRYLCWNTSPPLEAPLRWTILKLVFVKKPSRVV